MQKVFKFKFIFNIFYFCKIIIVFSILMLLLYWIKNLAGLDWPWLSFISPILDFFLSIGEAISKDSWVLLGAVFEYKYMWALFILLALYYLANLSIYLTEAVEQLFDNGKKVVKKIEEKNFNKNLEKDLSKEQLAIKNYFVYVGTSIKKKYAHLELNINFEEQNKIMNKFLIEKLNVQPSLYKNGFLYSFSDFNSIDTVLDVFFKLLKSNSQLNYNICVQIYSNDKAIEMKNLDKLIDLKFENKISTLSDTVYRYKFNKFHKYGTSQLGIFQHGETAVEAHEFIEI